jgi:hypothetical protein
MRCSAISVRIFVHGRLRFPKEQFERVRDAVLNGKPPTMPPWRDKVTDEDIKLLWVYVRSGG